MAGEFDDAWFQDLYGRVTDNFAAESKIADFLRTPEAYGVPQEKVDAVRTAFIQELIEDTSKRPALFGYSNTSSPEVVARDQETIGSALRSEFQKGTITAEDLASIPYDDRPGLGSTDLMSMLLPEGSGIGGAGEALAERLEERNQGNDAAVAAMAYASSPELMDKHLDTPEKRAAAFESLLAYNDTMAKADANGPAVDQGIVAIAKLYDAHAEEIVARYAPGDDGVAQPEKLSWFYSQTIFNPHAKDLEVAPGQSIADSVSGRTGEVVDRILNDIDPADPKSMDHGPNRLGRLGAAMAGGLDYATQIHAGLIEGDRANAEFIASGVDKLLGKIPVVGGYTAPAVDAVTDRLVERAGSDRLAPDPTAAEYFYDNLSAALGGVESRTGNYELREKMRDERDSEYNEQLLKKLDDGPASPRQHASIGSESVTPDTRALLTSPDHPQHARYAGCLGACADPGLGLTMGDRPTVAAALAAQSMADGLPRIDSVVQNRDATLLIGVMGNVEDPASMRSVLPRDAAIGQSIEASTQKVDALMEQQNRTAALQPLPPEREQSPRAAMV